MSGVIPDDRLAHLPAELPIFPLPGVLLLPHGHLPLHIFEPRYLNMVEHALGGSRMIGMIQPSDLVSHPVPDGTKVYEIGCAGRIISFAETDDGGYLITLRGVCRFRIVEELAPVAGYRRISPDFAPFHRDLEEPADDRIDRGRLLDAARVYLHFRDATTDWSAVESASDQMLVNSLAMMCPFEPREKQALLECADFAEQSDMLITLLEMAVHEAESSANRARH
jgi:Lon protease-like protein